MPSQKPQRKRQSDIPATPDRPTSKRAKPSLGQDPSVKGSPFCYPQTGKICKGLSLYSRKPMYRELLNISFIISCVWLQSINKGFTPHSCTIYNTIYPFHNSTFSRSIPRNSTAQFLKYLHSAIAIASSKIFIIS